MTNNTTLPIKVRAENYSATFTRLPQKSGNRRVTTVPLMGRNTYGGDQKVTYYKIPFIHCEGRDLIGFGYIYTR